MNINDLPPELLLHIMSYIPQRDLILSVNRVCASWNELCLSQSLWTRVNYFHTYKNIVEPLDHFYNVQHYVQDLSIPATFLHQVFLYYRQLKFFNATSLHITHTIQEDGADSFFENLTTRFPNLTSLRCTVSVRINMRQCLRDLCKLNLETINITSYHLVSLDDDLLYFINRQPHLKHLILYGWYKLRDETIAKILDGFPNISSIDLDTKYISSKAFTTSTKYTQLSNVSIHSELLDNDGLKSLLERSHGLRRLDINRCQNITDEGFQSVATNCPILEELRIGASSNTTRISNETIQAICDRCPKLWRFSKKNCYYINDSNVLYLVKSCIYLKHMNLNHCKDLTNETLGYFGKYCQYLENIWIEGCMNISVSGINTLITSCKQLKICHVVFCRHYTGNETQINDLSKESGTEFTNSHLRCLRIIGSNHITNESILRMTKFCPDVNSFHISSYLQNETVDDRVDSVICKIFDNCRCLQTFVMRGHFYNRRDYMNLDS